MSTKETHTYVNSQEELFDVLKVPGQHHIEHRIDKPLHGVSLWVGGHGNFLHPTRVRTVLDSVEVSNNITSIYRRLEDLEQRLSAIEIKEMNKCE
jgi:hypothetical protein